MREGKQKRSRDVQGNESHTEASEGMTGHLYDDKQGKLSTNLISIDVSEN